MKLKKLFSDSLLFSIKKVQSQVISHEKQNIGFIYLRLTPPSSIKHIQDILYLFLNHEFLRVIILACWLIFCGLIETFMAQLSDIRYYSDSNTSRIVNYLLTVTIVYTLVGFAIQSPDWTSLFIILRRWGFIMGFIYIFRGITLLVTTLPSSLIDNCRPPEIELTGTLWERFGFFLSVISGTALTCTDNIFSGHTSMMVSCVMIWRVHSQLRRPFAWLLYAIVFTGILMILYTHFHYSVDVILAIYITFTAWDSYLHYVQEASMHYMFGFTKQSQQETFICLWTELKNTLNSHEEAKQIYDYLNRQSHPIGNKWLMKLIMYVDGLDIRFRTLGIFDEHGIWKNNEPILNPFSITDRVI
ncbi:uncharacterized protein BX663DRAFT_473542 [Cokeromyces recurvatus]|uniref:uncharacterized protein n=1 Tax=Cokeromyces recurvatus TaxID=90255 RepID=UPI00221F6EE6|nr:uncharacterized protein BX663DRAFT_473542 [Cokeromyces recurvatus]KAI7902390.1 hypothetical protein BX663DRAFT_473542 [Cokeromyces recurvatus]